MRHIVAERNECINRNPFSDVLESKEVYTPYWDLLTNFHKGTEMSHVLCFWCGRPTAWLFRTTVSTCGIRHALHRSCVRDFYEWHDQPTFPEVETVYIPRYGTDAGYDP